MTQSMDADPAGDLVLKLGSVDEVTLIRVQSKVLGLASPVFAAMLSPRFAEGQALENNKALVDSITTIDLPDDNPTVMSLLCKILHFKEDAAQRTFYPLAILMRLAEICEKYDMSRAIRPWSNIWMNNGPTIIPQLEWPGTRSDRAWVSYALRHHESFWKNTRDIVRHSTLAELNIRHRLLPDNVIVSLHIHCKELLDQLQSDVESLVEPLLECDCHTEEYEGGVHSCEHHIMLGNYMKHLYRCTLWPISNIQRSSIAWVSRVLQGFEENPAGQHKIEALLGKAVHAVDCKVTGLCISCVKHGRYTEKDGNCHAELECHFSAKTEHETG